MTSRKLHDFSNQNSKVSDSSILPTLRMSKELSENMELEDRDPNSLSQHLQVSWSEIIGEPQTIRSPECAWVVSNQCYKISRNCCYTCLSVLCAPVAAFCLGITFACISFEHIWCLTPTLRIWKISCAATRNFLLAFTHGLIIPITSALGYCFSQIKLRIQTVLEESEKKDDVFLI